MAKPWEKFKPEKPPEKSAEGPWGKFAKNEPTDVALSTGRHTDLLMDGPGGGGGSAEEEPGWLDKEIMGVRPRGLIQGTLDALPAAGAMAGGVVGTALGPAGVVGGGMLGAAGGRALENIGESMMGERKTRDEIYMGPVRDAALEGGLMGAGGLVAKGVGAANKFVRKPITNTLARLGKPAKEGAEEVVASTQRLGAEPTRGMLTDDRFVQNLESSLIQTPSSQGQKLADKAANVNTAMTENANKIFEPFRTSESANQLAQSARKSVGSSIESKLAPAKAIYETLEEKAPLIAVDSKSLNRVAKNISKLPYVKIVGTAEESLANQINKNLAKIHNMGELRNIRSYVGKMAGDRSASPTMKATAGEIHDKLSRLEQNTITRTMFNLNKKKSVNIASKMIKDIRSANKIYRTTSNELKDLAKLSGMGSVKNYADFERKLADMSDEKLLQTLFKPNNERLLTTVQKQFPEAFDSMRKAKMMEIYEKSLTKGEISIPKLLNNAKNLSPSVKKMMFGDTADATLRDIEVVYNNIPQRVGPSGTPEGLNYMGFNPFSPASWYRELSSQVKAKVLENPQAFARFKLSLPEEEAVRAFKSPLRAQTAKRGLLQSTTPRGLMNIGKGLVAPQPLTEEEMRRLGMIE